MNIIEGVMTDIMDSTKLDGQRIINFRWRNPNVDLDYINIVPGTGRCSSNVGKIGGIQVIIQRYISVYNEIWNHLPFF